MDYTWNFELYGYHGWYNGDGVRSDEHIKDWPMLIGEVLGLI